MADRRLSHARSGYDKGVDAARFFIELQTRAGAPADVRDPLTAARAYLDNACEDEARALRLVIGALLSGRADLEEADLWTFTPEGARLAAALIDAQMRGLYKDSEWRSALLRLV